MKNIRNILLLLIAVMVLAACSPETGEQDLTDEDIALLGNVTKESFDAFDVLETGTELLTVGDYTVQVALTVESSTNWHMVISGVSSTDSSDAFSYTITSEDYSDQAKEITVTYKGSHAVTADKLLDSVKLPADPDAVLEDDEIAILNEAAIEGFKGFGYLISGTFEYDATGNNVIISIMPTLSSKKAHLVRQEGFILYYRGQDPDYRFVLECWPDNGTIKRLSVFRDDIGLEIRYLSNHQNAL